MQLIQCSKKLQKEIGLKKGDLVESCPKFSFLGSWHANLLHISRKKCVLFVNDKTLFNFIVAGVSREEIRKIDVLFTQNLSCVLLSEGIPEEVKEKVMHEYREIKYANTSNKSVIGSMNDLAFHYKHHILSEGGVHSAGIPGIIHKLNHMPMGAIGYKYSIEALKELYESTITMHL